MGRVAPISRANWSRWLFRRDFAPPVRARWEHPPDKWVEVLESGDDFVVRDSTGMHCAFPELALALDVAYQRQIEIEADSPR
jgi:hypothetical protein